MRYCELCGTGHDCSEETGREKTEVAIARLETNRDIEVARIQASAAKDIAEEESRTEVAHAEGVVEGVETVLDAAGGDEPGAGEPIVVEAATDDSEPVEEPGPDVEAPPVVEVPTPHSAKNSGGWWAGYR